MLVSSIMLSSQFSLVAVVRSMKHRQLLCREQVEDTKENRLVGRQMPLER